MLDDRLRDDAPALLAACKARGWRTLLLSGDSSPMVASVAAELGIDEARGSLRPDDKLQVLQQLHKEGRKVLMLGDGVNDVPVLAAADISVAMGSATDLAKPVPTRCCCRTASKLWCKRSHWHAVPVG